MPDDVIRHHAHELRLIERSPAVTFHGPSVLERASVGGIRISQKILKTIDRQVEVEIIHVPDVKVNLAGELLADPRPVLFQVIAKVVAVVAHVKRNLWVDASA